MTNITNFLLTKVQKPFSGWRIAFPKYGNGEATEKAKIEL
jgi:hypothetical protein